MLDPNRVLLDGVLKRTFFYYLTIVNSRGEEKEITYKMSKKEFLKQLGALSIRVILVDNYPSRDNWELGILYICKNGKAVYYKEKEGRALEF